MAKLKCPLANESIARTLLTVFSSPFLRKPAFFSISSVFRNFFLLQYRAVLFPGRIPVSRVDHKLDEKIPFRPAKAEVYLDFIYFYIRALGFLLRCFPKQALPQLKKFIESLGAVYRMAGEVYAKNLSTTRRPRYLGSFRFMVIHAFDPHLLCIPSLHVMIVIRAYTHFRAILKDLGEEKQYASQIEELRQGALAITEAVLYIKQHSVNCIPAAMYAMTCFDPALFPPEEARNFVQDLFRPGLFRNSPDLAETDVREIRDHIMNLYQKFFNQKKEVWDKPLLDFLQSF